MSARLLVAMTLGVAACQPEFSAAEIESVSNPPVGITAVIRDYEFEIPEGVAIAVQITPISGNATPYGPEDTIRLESQDEGVLDTEPTPDANVWVVIGVAAGDTCIELEINGQPEECIDTTVVTQ